MNIADKTVVSFHYTLSNTDGDQIEASEDGQPTSYLHGSKNIIRGLEEAMAGRVNGESFSVTLTPEEAYGRRDENLKQRVPAKHLNFRGKLKAGMVAELNTDKGTRRVTVIKAGRHTADIDANHPLAGKPLTFAVTIADVRAASAEELAHGHAHGAGGHQH
jgi:FKBP-type peptidyl-prolyl cis-trans isomerase SlyD